MLIEFGDDVDVFVVCVLIVEYWLYLKILVEFVM